MPSFSASGYWHVSTIFQQLLPPKRLFSENAEIKKKKTKNLKFSKKSFNALTSPRTALLQDYLSRFLAILHGMQDFIPQPGMETAPPCCGGSESQPLAQGSLRTTSVTYD